MSIRMALSEVNEQTSFVEKLCKSYFTVATVIVDYLYENNESFQEFVDSEVGEAIQQSIENPIIVGPIMPSLRFYDGQ